MNRSYIRHNDIYHYWLISILCTPYEEHSASFVFKGKTLEGAIKAAQKYCKEHNSKIAYETLTVGEVLYECDYWGREV